MDDYCEENVIFVENGFISIVFFIVSEGSGEVDVCVELVEF